jgi:TolB-like protein
MRMIVRAAMTLASVTMFAPVAVEAQAKPVIAVMYFDNNSIGKDRADFDGVGKGIADMLITDMASNANIRLVDRAQVQALLTEQNLTKQGSIDPQTAVRLGKIIGAQYMVTGGFMSDGRGNYVLTARAINVETSAITNPVRLTSKGDDVLGFINQLSQKLNNDMKLPALQVGQAGSSGAQPAGQPAAATQPATAAPTQVASSSASATATAAPSKKAPKMDIRTAMLYSKALEEEDAGNRTKAVELYRQVVSKFPEYAPAQAKIAKLSRS